MTSIALFPCSCTPVTDVVRELQQRNGFTLFDDKTLIEAAATMSSTSPEKLQKMLVGKTSVFNQFTLERERCVNSFKAVLAEKFEQEGACLYFGFLTSLIPGSITHILKTLLVDTKQGRSRYAEEQGLTAKEAKKAIHDHDYNAYCWTDFLCQKEAYDRSIYDLVIPVDARGTDELTTEILKTFHNTALLRTHDSQQAIVDFKVEVELERLLLASGHKLKITVQGEKATLQLQKDVLSFSRLSQELTDISLQIKEISKVEVKRDPVYTESIYRRQRFELPSRVLFVDDEKEFVKTVSARLISRDVGTYGVYNGEQALEVVTQDKPDVMVLDLKMPGLHGVEVLRRTKEIAPEVEVIILTGHGTSEDMRKCMELGAFAYMNKPVDIEELSATIKAANEKVHGKAVRAA